MAQIPTGSLVKGEYNKIQGRLAMYFSSTVSSWGKQRTQLIDLFPYHPWHIYLHECLICMVNSQGNIPFIPWKLYGVVIFLPKSKTHMLNVWYIYLYLPLEIAKCYGKYTIHSASGKIHPSIIRPALWMFVKRQRDQGAATRPTLSKRFRGWFEL